ncbi:Aspartate racemase [hydrothermal vent metagenome]|uniref:Aspartate racemase n=1 Tax=hydrothermal vent metagenome TaxID=652676 RepID=A0A3B0U1W6_9ZZZZ
MKTIGLIGGMSWESSAHYYRLINQEVARRLGGLNSASLLLHSVNFAPIARMQAENDWSAAGAIMVNAAKGLETCGAGVLAIATNTMHIVAPEVERAIDIPLIHIATPTANKLLKDGVKTVALLGTSFTMEMDFYSNRLKEMGLEPLVPEMGITELNTIIYHELCRGIVSDSSRKTYIDAIERLQSRGAEAVILGCTEIGMLIDDNCSPIPTYDTTELHAMALVDHALQ